MMMLLYKNIIHLSLEILLAWIKGTVQGGKGHTWEDQDRWFSCKCLNTGEPKEQRFEPLSSPPPYHSLRNLSPLLFILFPSVERGTRRRNHLYSRPDQTDLLFSWSHAHKVILIFQFSGVIWDLQNTRTL